MHLCLLAKTAGQDRLKNNKNNNILQNRELILESFKKASKYSTAFGGVLSGLGTISSGDPY